MTKHQFKKAYYKTTQPYLKILEILLCFITSALLWGPDSNVTDAVYGQVPSILQYVCLAAIFISVLLFILYRTCGKMIEHILAFQIYLHLLLCAIFIIMGALVLRGVLRTYTYKEFYAPDGPASQGTEYQVRPIDFEEAKEIWKELLECAPLVKPSEGPFYAVLCKIFHRSSKVACLPRKKPSASFVAGGALGIVTGLVFLLDGVDCIFKDKAPLRCSCSGNPEE